MGKVLWKDSLENDTHIYIFCTKCTTLNRARSVAWKLLSRCWSSGVSTGKSTHSTPTPFKSGLTSPATKQAACFANDQKCYSRLLASCSSSVSEAVTDRRQQNPWTRARTTTQMSIISKARFHGIPSGAFPHPHFWLARWRQVTPLTMTSRQS